ncbi:MAG: hypothetical protein ACXAD7_00460 [Candidatus Kariarchaeaceae archaeon]|jgi:hypothetical protein
MNIQLLKRNSQIPVFQGIPLHIDLLDYYLDPKKSYWEDSRIRCINLLNQLDPTHKRFLNPHIYKISLTEQ